MAVARRLPLALRSKTGVLEAESPEGGSGDRCLPWHLPLDGFEVVRDRKRSENGYYDFLNKRIAVRPDVSTGQALKTLIHELGHALLHAEGPVQSREVAEVEVESVAYIVCDARGLDTSDYSFSYVARWASGDVERIKETGECVVSCARSVLAELEVTLASGRSR